MSSLIFLDIDGCLATFHTDYNRTNNRNSGNCLLSDGEHYVYPFDPKTVKVLNKLTDSLYDAKIVVSSVWREMYSFSQLVEIFQKEGVTANVYDVTPIFHDKQRGDEIKFWLENKNLNDYPYVILDDDNDMDAVRDNFVLIDAYDGLTEKYLKTIHRILCRQGVKYKDLKTQLRYL